MNKRVNRLTIIIGAVLLLALTFFSGYQFAKGNGADNTARFENGVLGTGQHDLVDFDAFWKVWDEINSKYVTSEMPSDSEKMYGAIAGVVASLDDPYSVFLPPVEAKMFEEDVQGSFSGVGMEVGKKDDVLTVIAPLKDTPADKAGVMSGDKIIAIDGESTYDQTVHEAVSMIRGEKGSTVILTIVREGRDDILEISIVRDEIQIPIMETELRDDGVFVVGLYSFSATSPGLFTEAIQEFLETGSKKMILDLRGNPGGFLGAAVDIASFFLPAGDIVAREFYGEGVAEDLYRSKGFDVFDDSLELVILLDGGSASASEILAGALREHGVATIIGAQSFGKGSVQELIDLEDGTSLKLTIARWLTPNGISISEQGLTPDIEIDITIEDFEAGNDPQLDKAVTFLLTDDKSALLDINNTTDNESPIAQERP